MVTQVQRHSDATSLPAEPRHVSFDNVLGSVAYADE